MSIAPNQGPDKTLELRNKVSVHRELVLRAKIAQFDASGYKTARFYEITAFAIQVLAASIAISFAAVHFLPFPSPIPVWGSVLGSLGTMLVFNMISSRVSQAALTRREAYQTDVLALELIQQNSESMPPHVGDLPATDDRIPWHRQEEDTLKKLHPSSLKECKRHCDALGLDLDSTARYALAQRSCSVQSSPWQWGEVAGELIRARQELVRDPSRFRPKAFNDQRYQEISELAYQRAYGPGDKISWTTQEKTQAVRYIEEKLEGQDKTVEALTSLSSQLLQEVRAKEDKAVQGVSPRVLLCAIDHLKVCLQARRSLAKLYEEHQELYREYNALTGTGYQLFSPGFRLAERAAELKPIEGLTLPDEMDLTLQAEQQSEAQFRREIIKIQHAIAVYLINTTTLINQVIEELNARAFLLELKALDQGFVDPKDIREFKQSYDAMVARFECHINPTNMDVLIERLKGQAWIFLVRDFYKLKFQEARAEVKFDGEEYLNRYCRRLLSDQKERMDISSYNKQNIEAVKATLSESLQEAIKKHGETEAIFERAETKFGDVNSYAKQALDNFLMQDRTLLSRRATLLNLLMVQQRLVNRNQDEGIAIEEVVVPPDVQCLFELEAKDIQLGPTGVLSWQAIPDLDKEILRAKFHISQLEGSYQTHQAEQTKLDRLQKRLEGARDNAVAKHLDYLRAQPVAMHQWLVLLESVEKEHSEEIGVALQRAWSNHEVSQHSSWGDLIAKEQCLKEQLSDPHFTHKEDAKRQLQELNKGVQSLFMLRYQAWKKEVQSLDPYNPDHVARYQQALSKLYSLVQELPPKCFSLEKLEQLVKHTVFQQRLSQGYRDAVVQQLKLLQAVPVEPAMYAAMLSEIERKYPEKLKQALGQAWKIEEIESYHKWKESVKMACYKEQDKKPGGKFDRDAAKFHRLFAKMEPDCFDLEFLWQLKLKYAETLEPKPYPLSMSHEEFLTLKTTVLTAQDKYVRKVGGAKVGPMNLEPCGENDSDSQRKQLTLLRNLCQCISYDCFVSEDFETVVSKAPTPVQLYHATWESLSTAQVDLSILATRVLLAEPKDGAQAEEQAIVAYQKQQEKFEQDFLAQTKAVDKLHTVTGYRGTLTFKGFVAHLANPYAKNSFFSLNQEDLRLQDRHIQKIEAGIPPLDRSRRTIHLYVQILLVRVVATLALTLAIIYVPNNWAQLGLIVAALPVFSAVDYGIRRYMRGIEQQITQRRIAAYLYAQGKSCLMPFGSVSQEVDGTEWRMANRLTQTAKQNKEENLSFRKSLLALHRKKISTLTPLSRALRTVRFEPVARAMRV